MYVKACHFNQEIIILSQKYFSPWTCWDHSPFLLADCWLQEWPVAARPPTFALGRFLLLWSDTIDKAVWGGKGLFHLALPSHRPSLKEAEGRNLEAGADMEVIEGPLLTGLLLMTCSACLLQNPGPLAQGRSCPLWKRLNHIKASLVGALSQQRFSLPEWFLSVSRWCENWQHSHNPCSQSGTLCQNWYHLSLATSSHDFIHNRSLDSLLHVFKPSLCWCVTGMALSYLTRVNS